MADNGYWFYPNDWQGSSKTKLWNMEQGLTYRLLIDLVSTSPVPGYACAGTPGHERFFDKMTIAKLLASFGKTPDEMMVLLDFLEAEGVLKQDDEGRWYQPQSLTKAARRQDKSEAAKKGLRGRKRNADGTLAPAHAPAPAPAEPPAPMLQHLLQPCTSAGSGAGSGALNLSPNGDSSPDKPDDGVKVRQERLLRFQHQELVDTWNEIFPHRTIRTWTDADKDKVRTRVAEDPARRELAWWRDVIQGVKDNCPFAVDHAWFTLRYLVRSKTTIAKAIDQEWKEGGGGKSKKERMWEDFDKEMGM